MPPVTRSQSRKEEEKYQLNVQYIKDDVEHMHRERIKDYGDDLYSFANKVYGSVYNMDYELKYQIFFIENKLGYPFSKESYEKYPYMISAHDYKLSLLNQLPKIHSFIPASCLIQINN